MGFKTRICKKTFILNVFLILNTIGVTNGCKIIVPDGEDVDLSTSNTVVYVELKAISDDSDPGPLYTYSTEGITSFEPGEGSEYLSYTFDNEIIEISITESYKDWEKVEDADFSPYLSLTLEADCKPGVKVSFRTAISKFTNGHKPVFPESRYNITLPMPLPAGFNITGNCGATEIEATDYDYNSGYKSNVEFSLDDTTKDLEVFSSKSTGKNWSVTLKTTKTLKIETPLRFVLTAYDISPEDTEHSLSSEVEVTIIPDLEASTPSSPLFENPIYILDIADGAVIDPIKATLVEGYSAEIEVDFIHSHGENLVGFFDADVNGSEVIVTPNESFTPTELSGNFGVLILVAKHRGTDQTGKTVIHVTLPGNYATPPPTSTTESTTVCPPCTTEIVTDCPVQETTPCPEVTCPTERTTLGPEITCPTIETTSETLPCTCPEITCPTIETTSETLPCTCPEIICPTEGTTHCQECTPCSNEDNATTTISSTSGTTDVTNYTTGISTSSECTPCDCSSAATDVTKPVTGAPGSSTSPEGCPSCPDSPTTCTPCADVTIPKEEKWVRFRDPEAIINIYSQETGYVKTMSAFCSHECNIVYNIEDGPLTDSLSIDSEGRISVMNIKAGGQFYVTAVAEIEGDNYKDTAMVYLNVMTLKPCENGSEWTYSITVKPMQEGLKTPHTLEKCNVGNGCVCTLEKVIPANAEEYFIDGEEIVLIKTIDREDGDLFPDQSNTDIILQLQLTCESGTNMPLELWNKRSKSAIDEIGNTEFNVSGTVLVLQIGDKNDNRPKFDNITSPLTVGYPNAKIAKQLLPPYLIQVQATDIDFGENATIKYSLVNNDQFTIHEKTGIIYPVEGAFKYVDTSFVVHAHDAEGEGEPLEVNVKILSHDNLLVIKKVGSLLEDKDAVLQKISSITKYNIKLLSAAVIASGDDYDDDDNGDNDSDDRKLDNFRSTRNSSGSLLQLVIYGLNNNEQLLNYKDIKVKLEEEVEFKVESWTANNNSDGSSDEGLFIAVIVLSVLLALLLGGAAIIFTLHIRSKRKITVDNYKSNTDSDESPASLEVTEPSPQASPSLPRTTAIEPEQKLSDGIVPGDFDHGTAHEYEDLSGDEDAGKNEEGEDDNSGMTRRKSVVTFNDNVERIEIE